MEHNNVELQNDKGEKPSLLGMIWSPAEQFLKIRQRPTIWLPLILISILFTIGTYLTVSTIDYSSLFGEEIGLSAQEVEIAATFTKVISIVVGFFTPVFIILITSVIYLVICKIAKSDVKFKHLFSMTTYITFISTLGLLLNGLISMAIGGESIYMYTSIAGVLGTDNAVLGAIELFSIWGTILTAIGLQKVAKLSKGLSWGVTITFFVLGLLMSWLGMLLDSLSSTL